MNPLRTLVLCGAALLLGAASLVACETETPTSAVVDNGYPATVVYRAWWEVTYFADPVPGGTTSAEERSVPATNVAYAVLAPGWDPAGAAPPATFVALKSKTSLSSTRGETLHIAVSDQTFLGNCAAGQPLSQDDADFITQRIFPGVFAGATYDAKTCTLTPVVAEEAGADAGTDG
jgi:hypothetical protein